MAAFKIVSRERQFNGWFYLCRISAGGDDVLRRAVNSDPLFDQLKTDAAIAAGDQHGTSQHFLEL